MSFQKTDIREHLNSFNFKQLFIESLGWDNYQSRPLNVPLEGTNYIFEPIAQKRGMVVLVSHSDTIPEYQVRLKLERQVARIAHEHLIIYVDKSNTRQVWQWVRRKIGNPTASREITFYKGQTGEALIEKLRIISFNLEEEEGLSLLDVTSRAVQAFDIERITKKFYEIYKKQSAEFLKSIKGIELESHREWYASLMLDRLMFIYFIQKKGFLDNNPDYLRSKLKAIQELKGKNKFLTYYRYFLLRLFHEGLGAKTRNSELNDLLGKVPYLNGGLFSLHPLELGNKEIQIPDAAFEKLFDFFENFHWYLDDRPLRQDNEINPDVLGYIFEKYVNQKEMGAYYTKDDITEYMAKNIVIPFLLNALERSGYSSETNKNRITGILSSDPERYINESMRKGIISDEGNFLPLPNDIEVGIHDVSRRTRWNETSSPEFGLPSETWREYVSRRKFCKEIHERILRAEICSVDQFVTFNLDIRQFTQDFIEGCDSPEQILQFFHCVQTITVLDPTCGSGAFLFQALNVLERIYESILDQIDKFASDSVSSRVKTELNAILAEVGQHPNRRYFIFRSIILNNLFGVDIMEEATEICKLRLFLKLVAQIEPDFSKSNFGLEPLPDIDFNIRAGNTLVGFTNYDQVKLAITSGQVKLGYEKMMDHIEEKTKAADSAFQLFKDLQKRSDVDDKILLEAKRDLGSKLENLSHELSRYLALDYGVSGDKKSQYNKWLEKYKPFHWLLEFYSIMRNGGFDVVIGNPPYLESRQVDYIPKGYHSESTGTIHAMCIERSLSLLQPFGCISMIVPLSLVSTQRMKVIQDLVEKDHTVWYSNYSERPGKLFDTVNRPLTIFVSIKSKALHSFSTNYRRWNSNNRQVLFQIVKYTEIPRNRKYFWAPKFGDPIENSILKKLLVLKTKVEDFSGDSEFIIFYRNTGGRYWKVFTDFAPLFKIDGKFGHSTRETEFSLTKKSYLRPMIAALSSDIFWWWYTNSSNCRDLNPMDIRSFRIPREALEDPQMAELGVSYLKDLQNKSKMLVSIRPTGKIETQTFKIQRSKKIIDEIDEILSRYYHFTVEELDFLQNYDIKFRTSDLEDTDSPDGE